MKLDIIGDIHGCFDEFVALTKKLGYTWDKNNVPIHEHRKLAFVGDLTDRGSNSLQVIQVVYKLVMKQKLAYYVPGNHCDKLYRFFLGRNVEQKHGLETTVAEFQSLSSEKQKKIAKQFISLYESAPLYVLLDKGKLVIAHAGIQKNLIGKHTKEVKKFVLYGDITGETLPDGSPVRKDWAQSYDGKATIVYGHTPTREARFVNRTVNIDTGCVWGGNLTALRYPEMEIVSVPSSMSFMEKKFRF